MQKLRLVGALWLAVAALSISLTLVFRVEASQIVVTIALGVATAVLGTVMLARPNRAAITASIVAGIAWLALYVGLAVIQADELAAWTTDAFLAVAGVGIAILAWTARSQFDGRPPGDERAG